MIEPLSFAQQRLWFLAQMEPDNPFYHIPAAIHCEGLLDQAALQRSLTAIVQRHAALRTTFDTVAGEPMQVIAADRTVELVVVDLQRVAEGDRPQISQQLAIAEAQRPFNLTSDPLLRVTLLQFAPTSATLLLTLHHIVADGWSLGILIQELATYYTAFVAGTPADLPPLPLQYPEFARWQRQWLQGDVLTQQLTYWRQQLQNLSPLPLPTDFPRPAVQTYRGATFPLQIEPELTQVLTTLSQQSGASLFMTLLAAFQVLLHRYTEQTDIGVGSPIANRHHSQVEGLIGFFVNSLVLRSDLSGNPTFRELLARVREVALAAYQHQDLPFEKLVEDLEPDRDLSRNPLFQVAFALQNAPMQPLDLPGLHLKPAPIESMSTRFDLELHLWEPDHGLQSWWESGAGLGGFIAYSTDLFERDRIARLAEHWQTLLAGIATNPDARLSDLPLMPPGELQTLRGWSQFPIAVPPASTWFHQRVEQQAQQTPTAIALWTETGSWTYQALNQQSDRLAHTLQHLGVQPDQLVGLCVERSADWVIGILGILKAGGVYLPLDPGYPRDRLQFLLTDTQISILLTQSWLVDRLPNSSAQILCLDHPHPPVPASPLPTLTGDNLAYAIYTSGSTGTPKGVLLTHRGLRQVVAAQQPYFQLEHNSRILQFSAISFDASVFELVLALGRGATLYIPPRTAQLPDQTLVQFLQDQAITHALLTPAVLAVLPPADLPDLRVLITGGDRCSQTVVDRWARQRHFFNAYGPTESTIWATVAELQPGDRALTIGRPIPGIEVQILDSALRPAPIGIPGELHIGGPGLARGYLHRPELTAERFIETEWGRLYKTGDRARYGREGQLEFLGRLDYQVKLRGFRVELGEIEATLRQHPAIQDAVVLASDDPDPDRRLIAYFSLNRIQSTPALPQDHLHHWQTLYDQTYQPQPDAPTHLNITGWNSSYTGQPIPSEEMQDWVSDRVQPLLAFKPQRVLEIGCGTGLLLLAIAPHCQRYVGTDFSSAALDSLGDQVRSLPQVELRPRQATDFTNLKPAEFDLVILNSVVQYFPSVEYLLQVLDGVFEVLAPGGVVFLGDIRSLPLLTAFHTWVEFQQAEAGLTRTQLRQKVERACFEEPELVIDPALFEVLRDRFPSIQSVQIQLSRGHYANEMTQFRYNVLLQTQPVQTASNPSLEQHNWRSHPVAVEIVRDRLLTTKPDQFLLTNVANSRVNAAVQTAHWLFHATLPKTVGRMREQLQTSPPLALDPEDWWALAAELPYTVTVAWSPGTTTGDYQVWFVRQDSPSTGLPQLPTHTPNWTDYTNNPLQAQVARQLLPELRHFLQQHLPEYMVPAAFIALSRLPLTSSGKVDRRALPPLEIPAPSATPTSSTTTEATLQAIWEDLLRFQPVHRDDNFFELGGHSLLATQMTSRIRDALELELPLKTIFEAPTIAQLAPQIDRLRHTTPTSQMPPLVRLDRAAYRCTRASLINPTPPVLPPAIKSAARSPLVPLTMGGHPSPFFCVHPMFGMVLPYLELAHLLGDNRSFYGLQPQGLDGKTPPLNQMEAIAAHYIRAIQTVQPRGPYLLGGWSFGGLVAFEMAQQLTRSGQSVQLLAILDTPAPCHTPAVGQSLKFLLQTALWATLPFLLDYGKLATQRMAWFTRWHWFQLVRSLPEASQLQLLDESAIGPMLKIVYANARAAASYKPQPYTQPLTLFRATDQPDASSSDSTLGWAALAPALRLHQIPGNHLSLLKHPHVETLAQTLRQYL